MMICCVTSVTMCRLRSPCDNCAAPYGFRNQLNLTEDTAKFRVNVAVLMYLRVEVVCFDDVYLSRVLEHCYHICRYN